MKRLQTVALSILLMAGGFATAALGSTITLDDFESGFAGMNGQLTATGAVTAVPKPKTVLGFRIDAAGFGGCDHLIGDSMALCGADTRKWAGSDGAILRYGLDFGQVSTISFDLAAFSHSDPFDHFDDENANAWGDYLRVFSVIGGSKTLLAEFTGVEMSARTPETAFGMVSTGAGLALGAGMIADATFGTVRLSRLDTLSKGIGELLFEIRSTGSSEQIGLDNIRYSVPPVPLPGALSLLFLGIGALVVPGCGRRIRESRSA